jgi:hypothetical protein
MNTPLNQEWKGPPLTKKGDRKEFIDSEVIPWTPWIMAGTYFKLFYVDEASGRFAEGRARHAGTGALAYRDCGGFYT